MMLDNVVETFEVSLFMFTLSMVIVGIPAIVLKLAVVGLVEPEKAGGRGKLIWRSVRYSAGAGAIAVLAHTILLPHFGPGAVEFTAAVLLVCVSVAEWTAWSGINMQRNRQAVIGAWVWFIFGNVWIVWALLLALLAATDD